MLPFRTLGSLGFRCRWGEKRKIRQVDQSDKPLVNSEIYRDVTLNSTILPWLLSSVCDCHSGRRHSNAHRQSGLSRHHLHLRPGLFPAPACSDDSRCCLPDGHADAPCQGGREAPRRPGSGASERGSRRWQTETASCSYSGSVWGFSGFVFFAEFQFQEMMVTC